MERNQRSQRAIREASRNAGIALDALNDERYENVPTAEKAAWAMAALIHCDMCRLVVALQECEPGIAKLLSMADVVSKLFEAKIWYLRNGANALREIAGKRACGTALVDEKLKELKSLRFISKIDTYAVYRNKIGFHYDANATEYILKFGQEESEMFYAVLTDFVRFSGEWAILTKSVIQSPANAT